MMTLGKTPLMALALILSNLPLAALAQAPGTPTAAFGNEPFWRASVAAAEMTLVRPGLADLALQITEDTAADAGGRVVVAVDRGQALRAVLTLEPQICADTMSGALFPTTAMLEMGDTVMVGCAGETRDVLTGAQWQAEDIAGRGIIDNSRVTLLFGEDGGLSGSGGCNRLMSSYELEGDALSILPQVATTMMACPEALMAQERAFIEALGRVEWFTIDATGALILHGAEGPLALLRRVDG